MSPLRVGSWAAEEEGVGGEVVRPETERRSGPEAEAGWWRK